MAKGKKVKMSKHAKPKRRKKRSNGLYALIVVLIIFFLVLCIALLVQLNVVDNPIQDVNSEPQLFNIRDECTMILGNLIHKIKDADGCELSCKTECGVRDMGFYSSDFIESDTDCHVCRCYCI
jgi:hypothetical protein